MRPWYSARAKAPFFSRGAAIFFGRIPKKMGAHKAGSTVGVQKGHPCHDQWRKTPLCTKVRRNFRDFYKVNGKLRFDEPFCYKTMLCYSFVTSLRKVLQSSFLFAKMHTWKISRSRKPAQIRGRLATVCEPGQDETG